MHPVFSAQICSNYYPFIKVQSNLSVSTMATLRTADTFFSDHYGKVVNDTILFSLFKGGGSGGTCVYLTITYNYNIYIPNTIKIYQ